MITLRGGSWGYYSHEQHRKVAWLMFKVGNPSLWSEPVGALWGVKTDIWDGVVVVEPLNRPRWGEP